MLIEQIRKDRIAAMKARNNVAKTLLTTLIGELEGAAKRQQTEITEEMVISACKKFIAGNDETIKLGGGNRGNQDVLEAENAILKNYLPKQLSEDELRAIIGAYNLDNIGAIMGKLKAEHAGLYDGGLASKIAREFL